MVPQTSHNEVVYSAVDGITDQEVHVLCRCKQYQTLLVAEMPGIWWKGKEIT